MASPQMNTVIPPAATQAETDPQPKALDTAAAAELSKPPCKHSMMTASFSSSASSVAPGSSIAPHTRGNSTQSNGTTKSGHQSKLSTDWHRSVIHALRTDSFDMRKAVHVPSEFTYSF